MIFLSISFLQSHSSIPINYVPFISKPIQNQYSKHMNKQQILCFQVPIKSSKQLTEFKKRQENHIPGTPKILLGKLLDDTQQIWTEEYKCHKVSALRELRSNDLSFQIALQIVNTTKQLIKVYGNFMLNQNMVFVTKSKKTFIWINPDIFLSSPKIYLPQTKEGQISMIKGLVNYLKLWLQTNFAVLNEVKTLEQFSFKIQQLKRQKPPTLSKDLSLAAFSKGSSKDSGEKPRLYESSKGITLKKLSKEESYSKQNSKNSDCSSTKEKCFTNRCFTSSQPLGDKYPKKLLTNQKCETSQASNVESGSQGQKGSFSNSFSKQVTKSFRNIKNKDDEPKFPHKTTSSTLHILQKIKQQDENPDLYTTNKIKIEDEEKPLAEEENKKLKSQLGGINEELDNLFLSNMESEENEEAVVQREKEFEQLLDL